MCVRHMTELPASWKDLDRQCIHSIQLVQPSDQYTPQTR